MQKSIHSARYAAFLRVLRETRVRAGVTQAQLCESNHQDKLWTNGRARTGSARPACLDYVGISPETGKAMYTTPAGAPKTWQSGCQGS
jgi:hypothetical protein